MLEVADALHGRAWRVLRSLPGGERAWDDPTFRTSTLAAAWVVSCLGLTAVAPLWLMLLAPLLFGVSHVAADLRYLLLQPVRAMRPSLLKQWGLTLGAMTLLRAAAWVGGPSLPRVELALGVCAVGFGWWAGRRNPFAGVALVALAGAALANPELAALMIGHAHNLVAVAFWVAWSPPGLRWLPVVTVGAGLALILGGAGDALWWGHGLPSSAAGLSVQDLVATLAPGIEGPLALRIVMSFAWLQAVHYGFWLVCIPSLHGPHPAPPSVHAAGWRASLGRGGVAAVILGSGALLAAGWVAPVAARAGYLSVVLFHGWLELAVAAWLLAPVHGR